MDNASYHSKIENKVPTISNRKSEVIEWLSSNNITHDPSASKPKLLQLAKVSQRKTESYLRSVVACHEKAAEGRDSLLCTAALLGHTNCVRILVEYRGADIEELGSVSIEGRCLSGVRPLWCASNGGHYWAVLYLLSNGANANGVTAFCGTPLRAACARGHLNIVRLLVEHSAYTEVTDQRAVTCLMLASSSGHLAIVRYLLEVGANVNSKDIDGESALHACANTGHLEVMKLLLDHDARMAADYSGLTPLIVASLRGHRDMVEYLLSRTDLVSVQEEADALELLGDSFQQHGRYRYVNGALIYPKTDDNLLCPSLEEFSEVITLQDLENIELDPEEVQVQALLVMERILGPGHSETMKCIKEIGIDYVNNDAIKQCIKL
ncbi:protein fem-1 homolog C-like [Macrobrachium rosenbergii]|uniref:protein fem-1 homolog C-like n=1 Tax=Macrobrachium rosenbergii TaxID=79674 RepID=UPI0034D5F85C